MKTHIPAILAAALLCGAVPSFAQTAAPAASAMLRLQCDGDSVGAEVFIDGKFRGECPFDTRVAEGELVLRAVKLHGDSHERVYTRTLRVAADTIPRLEIVLGAPQLTEAGRKLQAERERLAREEAERQAREAEAAVRQQVDPKVDTVLRQRREKTPVTIPDCPDCPAPLPSIGKTDMTLPTLADAQANEWARQALADMRAYLADPAGFRPPDGLVPLACPGAEAVLNEQARLHHLQTSSIVNYARDHKWWVNEGACVDGRLDGTVEAWVFAVEVFAYEGGLNSVTPALARLRLTMRAGQASGEFQRAFVNEHLEASGKPEFSIILFSRGTIGDEGESSVMVFAIRHADPKMAAHSSKKLTVVHNLALGDGRVRQSHYDGARLSWQYHARNGELHGRRISFEEGSQGEKCYRDGEEIKLDPCVVD